MPTSFNSLDFLDHHHQYPQDQQHHHQLMKFQTGETTPGESSNGMVDFMLNKAQQPPQFPSGFYGTNSFDKLSFADVMQLADFGPKLALNQTKKCEDSGIDPVYFLKFPVLNNKLEDQNLMVSPQPGGCGEAENDERFSGVNVEDKSGVGGEEEVLIREDEEARVSDNINNSAQLRFRGEDLQKSCIPENKNKRKRPRTIKTSEEVESQRMTHIAVERNRRKQMNEHLRVLRSLMPGSYVQRVSNCT